MTAHTINRALLTAAHSAWSAAARQRQRRDRYKRYTYGDQWSDMVRDSDGNLIPERELLSKCGRQPLTNNLIRRLVKTIVGRYRNMAAEDKRYGGDIADIARANDLAELDSRLLEEFLISGCAIQRIVTDRRPSRAGVWVDNVNPCDFFTGPFSDPRGSDVEMVGMLHNMSMAEAMARFAGRDERRRRRVAGIFSAAAGQVAAGALTGADNDFFDTGTPGRCRVIELWTLDAVRGSAGTRFQWHCRWLSSAGDLLSEYASPWPHGSHPFVFKFYPFTDGEVHPFVEDILDQQRYINRLIVLIDRMMGASAKGVLLFPVNQKVDGFSWDEVRRRWSAADGVIPITGRTNTLPQQVVGGGNDIGAHRLLELELKLFEDVSGVSEALLGNARTGNGGSTLYESQIANGTIALADIFETFSALTQARDNIALSLS